MEFLANERLLDRSIKTRTIAMRLQITGDATPADKVHIPDLGSELIILRTEGKTATADAIEDLSAVFTTPVDAADAVFGVLCRKEVTTDGNDGFGTVTQVLDVVAYDRAGTATTLDIDLLDGTGVSNGLTDDGNIAFEITTTGLNLAAENADITVILRYLVK